MPDEMNLESGTPSDITSILQGTSDSSETTQGAGGATGDQTGSGEGQSAFKFGGKTYASQKEAEEAHNKLYGKYSESQATFNKLKEALKNPQLFQQLSKDPNLAPILAKMGIQAQEEELEEELEADEFGNEQANLPPQLQKLAQQMKVDLAYNALDREKWSFERKLGRSMTPEESDSVMGIIAKADSLTVSEAWKLAFHDKLLKEAAEKAAAKNPQNGNRPRPLPPGIPGAKLDLKKNIADMSRDEWRESVRQSPDFQKLLGP